MRSLFFFMIVLPLFISGCSTVKEASQPPQNKTIAWDNRVKTLSNIQNWDLEGLIAIRNQASNGSGSANLKWQQNRQNYSMLFYGPMGAGSQKLTGRPGKVTLEMADGKKATAASPEALLASQTGWRLPVSNMYYWVRGLPAPGLSAEKKFDHFNHLIQLNQQGWTIQYQRYTSMNQIDVPTKILLANPQMNVKLIIKQWNF